MFRGLGPIGFRGEGSGFKVQGLGVRFRVSSNVWSLLGFKDKSLGFSRSVVEGGRLPRGSPGSRRLNPLQGSFTGSSNRV